MYDTETYGDQEQHSSGFVIGMLWGVAVGAAIGLLLAPKTGAEMRTTLADGAGRLRRRAGEGYDRASRAVDDMMERGRNAARRGREKFDQTYERASTAVDDVVERGRQAAERGRQEFEQARSTYGDA